MAVTFDKYEGLGNDFVVVDWPEEPLLSIDAARRMCDRHFGIGADGVILVMPAAEAAARMVVINADGSRPEMCGNGLRCVALHLALGDRTRGGQLGEQFTVDTDAGPRSCELQGPVSMSEDAGPRAQVRIGLGQAELLGQHSCSFGGENFEFSRVSMGNPHAVRFGAPVGHQRIDDMAPKISAELPGGANIEFATLIAGDGATTSRIDLIVWERGVGRTLACGTGAGATVAAAASLGHVPFDQPVTVRLPGGSLQVAVAEGTREVQLTGPARHVFSGRWLG